MLFVAKTGRCVLMSTCNLNLTQYWLSSKSLCADLHVRILSDLISINWSKSNTMVFSKEYTQCKVDRGQGCTFKASEGDSIPRGKAE